MMTVRIAVQRRFAKGSARVNGRTPRIDGHQMHGFLADSVADGSSREGSGGGRAQEQEQVDLGALHGDVEFGDQVKGVITGENSPGKMYFEKMSAIRAAHRDFDLRGIVSVEWRAGASTLHGWRVVIFIPRPDLRQNQNGDQGRSGEPCNRMLPFGKDYEGG